MHLEGKKKDLKNKFIKKESINIDQTVAILNI